MDAFTQKGCSKTAPKATAVTIQAGEHWSGASDMFSRHIVLYIRLSCIDVYRAAHTKGFTIVGGAARTVGAAGGWALGGGHSPLGHLHGMGVDSMYRSFP